MERFSYRFLVGVTAVFLAGTCLPEILAANVFTDNFDRQNGPLAGTVPDIGGTWTQNGTTDTNAIQIANGTVPLVNSGQDLYGALSSPVATVAGNALKTSLDLNVSAAQADSDIFFHLTDPLGTTTTTNYFQRLRARSSAGGYQLGLQDAAGTGSFTTWGTDVLSYGTSYHVDAVWYFVTGGWNDVFSVTLDDTPYLEHHWTSPLPEPAQLSGVNLRQGAASAAPTLVLDNLVVTSLEGVAPPTPNSNYSFTSIIDSTVAAPTGNYLNIGDAAISGNKVAFKAGYNQGFLGIIDSIFTSTGGPRTEVAQELRDAPSGGTFSALGRPSIDGNQVYFGGQVFFSQTFSYGNGIFSGEGLQTPNGPVVNTVGSPTSSTYRIFADPLRSNSLLAFRASKSSATTPDAIYTTAPGTPRIVGNGDAAPPGGTFSAIDVNYSFSNGNVAFRGFFGSEEGIFKGSGGPLTTIALKGDLTPIGETLVSLLDPSISGDTVAFLGTYTGGSGIFTGSGGLLTTIVKSGDTTPSGNAFTDFSTPAIGGNLIAFRGDYAGGSGIYTKSGDNLSKVVEIGDPLFGSTVASISFSDLGLDQGSTGNLAFTYGLANGRTGIAMAVPGLGLPTIFQDANGTIPVPDSVGIIWSPVPNFSGRNLTQAYLAGADLANANAHNVNLTNSYLKGADLTNANLTGADLTRANLEAVQFAGANLNGATVTGTNFNRLFVTTTPICNSGGCFNFYVIGYGGITPAQLYGTTNYLARDLTGIRLAGNDFTNANLVGQNLTDANFTYATLTGANLAGAEILGASFARYSFSTEAQCANFGTCTLHTSLVGTGITLDQLYSTTSYLSHNLTRINFAGNDLASGNFAEQDLSGANFSGSIDNSPAANLANANLSHANLTNANFGGATLTGADLSGADARGANLVSTGAVVTNLIRPDGHVAGLYLNAGQMLSVRDYDGTSSGTIPITVDQLFAMTEGGVLRMVLETNLWDSTISFAAGIPVALGGTLELAFADGTNLASQAGRTFKLFDWTGVAPTGAFAVSSPYHWDISYLYSTGEVTLTAVPEPATLTLFSVGLFAVAGCRGSSRR